MVNKNKTRAEVMAETYGKKLKDTGQLPKESLINRLSNQRTPEQNEKYKKAIDKLRTFLD
jgi:hypothetical protein